MKSEATKTIVPQYFRQAAKTNNYMEITLNVHKKISGLYRLAIATSAAGFCGGFLFHAVISMPPVWLGAL